MERDDERCIQSPVHKVVRYRGRRDRSTEEQHSNAVARGGQASIGERCDRLLWNSFSPFSISPMMDRIFSERPASCDMTW
jgi:hypothetical protein